MNQQTDRVKRYTRITLFWTLFIGLGAVAGGIGMLADPSGKAMGMNEMLPYFDALPFSEILFEDLLFSGIALLCVNGATNLTAALLIMFKKRSGLLLGGIFGVTLMLWICIQFYMFPLNFMSAIYFFFGLLQAISGFYAFVLSKRESINFDIAEYPNVGTNHNILVVYFSRMGYVREQAYIEANKTGSDIYEVKTTEPISGISGFWWCGRFGLCRKDMPIDPIEINLEGYDHIIICSPVWVFSLSAPIRSFCKAAFGRIKSASYILVHHTGGKYLNIAVEMDRLLGINGDSVKSVRCHIGDFKTMYEGKLR